jgi:hypothetical protein
MIGETAGVSENVDYKGKDLTPLLTLCLYFNPCFSWLAKYG